MMNFTRNGAVSRSQKLWRILFIGYEFVLAVFLGRYIAVTATLSPPPPLRVAYCVFLVILAVFVTVFVMLAFHAEEKSRND